MKKPLFLLLSLFFVLAIAVSVQAATSQVDSAESLAQALQDAKVTEIRLTQDIELPAEGLPVNMDKDSLSIDGGGATLRATGAGLKFGPARTTKYKVNFSSVRFLSEDDRPIISASSEGKNIIFSFQDIFFAGMSLIENPPGDCEFTNVECHVGKYLGGARNITFSGTNTIVRLNSSTSTTAMLILYPPNTGRGESWFTLSAGGTLAVGDDATNCGGFLYNQADEAIFRLDEKSQLTYDGSNCFITGNNLDIARLEPEATLNVRLLGNISAPILSVKSSFLVSKDSTVRLLATENTRTVPIVYASAGSKVSFGRAREVLLFNGCATSASDGLSLSFEGGKKSVWLNQTQVVELWSVGAQAYYGALGMPDSQWRNGGGALFTLDATMGEGGAVSGLKVSDYSGSIELSKETLSLSQVRILRLAMEERPEYLLAPFETAPPDDGDWVKPERTRDPLWDEDGNYIGPGSSGVTEEIYDTGEYDSGFVDDD